MKLPCVRTTVLVGELYSAIGDALWDDLGQQPRRESVLCLLAQWGIETGGGAACWNFNLTNIRHTPNDGRDYAVIPRCSEIIGGHEIVYTRETHPEKCEFRAYGTLEAATKDYLATLKKRFVRAWAAMLIGEPNAFALALHDDHFYTASPAVYAKALVGWYKRLDASLPTL